MTAPRKLEVIAAVTWPSNARPGSRSRCSPTTLAEIVGPRPQARTEMVKQIWTYIKSHRLQDPKDGRVIRPDGPLGRVLGDKRRVSMFEIARFLNLHLAPKP